ncbi:hypothetical protein LCGC14_1781730, partial [marine sediment metagenome]
MAQGLISAPAPTPFLDPHKLEEGRRVLKELETTPGATEQDLSDQQIKMVKYLLDHDLFAFNWFIFRHNDLIESLHGRICNLLNLWGWCELNDGSWTMQPDTSQEQHIKTDYRRLMILIPREFFKTSLATRANSLWKIVNYPNEPVVIVNERLENAKKWMRSIREVVENSLLFQVVYKDLLPPGIARWDNRFRPRNWKWTDDYLQFQRSEIGIPEASLTALGIGAAAAGGHWNWLIKDYLIS